MFIGVIIIFGFVNRFEDYKVFFFFFLRMKRRVFIVCVIMVVLMFILFIGLSNIVKYGYGYCGYFGLFIIVILFFILGYYKNKKFVKENLEVKWLVELNENVN